VGGRVVAEVASGCAGKAEPAGIVEGLGQHDGLAQQRRAPGGIASRMLPIPTSRPSVNWSTRCSSSVRAAARRAASIVRATSPA
jgi:hypothetical protein